MKLEKNNLLKDILNEWDLLGVMPYDGGPQDEYDWFAEQIKNQLEKQISFIDLEKYIETQVTEYFGLDVNEETKKSIIKYTKIIFDLKN